MLSDEKLDSLVPTDVFGWALGLGGMKEALREYGRAVAEAAAREAQGGGGEPVACPECGCKTVDDGSTVDCTNCDWFDESPDRFATSRAQASATDALYQHLLDLLGAKDHEDAARIIAGHHVRELASAAVPEGMVLVPMEPTAAMREAGKWEMSSAREDVWAAMLAAGQQDAASEPDPCPQCRKGGVCRTPSCGRLKLPVNHPYRAGQQDAAQAQETKS